MDAERVIKPVPNVFTVVEMIESVTVAVLAKNVTDGMNIPSAYNT
jgi:hypothetical protein